MEICKIPPNLAKFHIFPHLLCGKSWNSSACGEISNFSTSVMHWNLKFLHMTDFSPPIYRWSRWQIWGLVITFVNNRDEVYKRKKCAISQNISQLVSSQPALVWTRTLKSRPQKGCKMLCTNHSLKIWNIVVQLYSPIKMKCHPIQTFLCSLLL